MIRKICLSLGVITLVTGASVYAFHPDLQVQRQLNTLSDEFSQRIETTPFVAIPMFLEAIEHGTTTFSATERSAGIPDFMTEEMFGDLLLWHPNFLADSRLFEGSFAANGQGSFYLDTSFNGMNLGLHISPESLAVNVPLFTNGYVGAFFDTIVDDFLTLADMFDLPSMYVYEILEILQLTMASFDNQDLADEINARYGRFFTSFMLSGFRETNDGARRYSFNQNDIAAFLVDLADKIVNDQELHALGGGDFYGSVEFIEELILDFADAVILENFELTVSIYSETSTSRIHAISFVIEDAFGDIGSFTFDFGSHALDTWTLTLDHGGDNQVVLTWDISTSGFTFINTFTFTDEWLSDSIAINWNTSTGNFDIADFIFGNLVTTPNSFSLSFTDIPLPFPPFGRVMDFDITSTIGVSNIPNPTFTHFLDWSREMELLIRMFLF